MSTFRTPTSNPASADKGRSQQTSPSHGSTAQQLYPAAQPVNARPGDNFLSVAMRASHQDVPPLYHRK
ncbi:MAG: hypothetical protein CFE43_10675 [Burkholderiales bacterium PBB3]|nr:MAG: hypothetical protein CFE43_10675 [Burkholderiales bacterium PBB3]